MPHSEFHPVNLTQTQIGYVPLRDRFKSFPVDREFTSLDEIYFINRIGQYLEHATLDMILKVPAFVRQEVQNRRRRPSVANCLVDGDGNIILVDGKCMLFDENNLALINSFSYLQFLAFSSLATSSLLALLE